MRVLQASFLERRRRTQFGEITREVTPSWRFPLVFFNSIPKFSERSVEVRWCLWM